MARWGKEEDVSGGRTRGSITCLCFKRRIRSQSVGLLISGYLGILEFIITWKPGRGFVNEAACWILAPGYMC